MALYENNVTARPAAQYLRMSTEHQRYSLENQAAAIAEYAADSGYAVVKTYQDPGKSGLTLAGRKGLQSLLSDALRPDREFEAVLVLDVSRWGRFQDPDQAAHYEFLCREAGVDIVYCSEAFANDGSAATVILKQMKRLMAAEYSRELSEKVIRAQLQQARLGFKQGGARPYGARRFLIDPETGSLQELRDGEQKALRQHRVILGPGPDDELNVIRTIFRMFNRGDACTAKIAQRLNAQGVPSLNGSPWTCAKVRIVLRNEIAIGNYVFNKTSQRMRSRRRSTASERWVRVHLFPAIVSTKSFERAAELLSKQFRFRLTDKELLQALKRLLRQRGRLNGKIIAECPFTAHPLTYAKRFGSLWSAYEAIGYDETGRWAPPGGNPQNDAQLLELLRSAYERHGHISHGVIEADPGLPPARLYAIRFGSLGRAYKLAEVPHPPKSKGRRAPGLTVAPASDERAHWWPSETAHYSEHEIICGLQRLHAEQGRVSLKLISDDPSLPMAQVVVRRFGSLLAAYKSAGLPCRRSEIWRRAGFLGHQTRLTRALK
jgi:DNA invertase Pin-like site-specific DNA recombinase